MATRQLQSAETIKNLLLFNKHAKFKASYTTYKIKGGVLIKRSADFYDELCLSVYTTNRYFHQLYAWILQADGLTYLQYMVLLNVVRQPNCSLADICQTLGLDNNTLTPVTQKLIQKEWLVKERSAIDRRRWSLNLTPKARERFGKLRNQVKKLQTRLIGNSTSEFEHILRQSHALNQRLEEVLQQGEFDGKSED
ncbi:MarR family winged helix-turn-helix transcriptional regulator [Liquorilactobacillus nagelii]|uniref:MarR family winged helix-turn-helix transcriptional regulator n=1 Tax=Liquorilactobacillus nagelii TaxID=82688 RepID=UPI00242B7053|nr:MarR family transcriptional regulator [Liquorilactobacillus nagelii]MCI1700740.1 MarR family transcriptional regulator [Liquorilactobacillus nagelii]